MAIYLQLNAYDFEQHLAADGPTHVQGSFRDQAIAFIHAAKVLPRNISAFSAWKIK